MHIDRLGLGGVTISIMQSSNRLISLIRDKKKKSPYDIQQFKLDQLKYQANKKKN